MTRTIVLGIRLSKAEARLIDQAAIVEGARRPDFVRDLLVQGSLRWLEAVETQSRKSSEVDRGA